MSSTAQAVRVEWVTDTGIEIAASSAPSYHGDASKIDPEEAFAASVSSCHMLCFLHLACDQGYIIDSYTDSSICSLEFDSSGSGKITSIQLHPCVHFHPDKISSPEQVQALHQQAHQKCFIANSITSEISIHPVA